jgi:hypothetical protein
MSYSSTSTNKMSGQEEEEEVTNNMLSWSIIAAYSHTPVLQCFMLSMIKQSKEYTGAHTWFFLYNSYVLISKLILLFAHAVVVVLSSEDLYRYLYRYQYQYLPGEDFNIMRSVINMTPETALNHGVLHGPSERGLLGPHGTYICVLEHLILPLSRQTRNQKHANVIKVSFHKY